MSRSTPAAALLLLVLASPLRAANDAPRDNPYDVIARIFQPFFGVLLTGGKSPNKAASLSLVMSGVEGRLPSQMAGSTLKAAVQFPDKVRLEAPVLGETFTVCRNGNEVWATPGAKVEFLMSQFKVKPKTDRKLTTPIYVPVSPQQAIFLPALFAIENAQVAEVQELDGENCRVLTAGLMPELAKATKAEDFKARVWVASGYLPRRVQVVRKDFATTVDIRDLKFQPSLPESTWEPPTGVTDIYRTTPEMLEGLLYVIMNSLNAGEGDAPWLKAK